MKELPKCPKKRMFGVEPFRTMEGFTICRVNGAKIRDFLETEFLLGTNGYASKYCPKDEIWVEKYLAGKDQDAVIIHEVYEAVLMSRGMKYEKAHKKALALEHAYRKTGSLVRKPEQKELDIEEGWPVEDDKTPDQWTEDVKREVNEEQHLPAD